MSFSTLKTQIYNWLVDKSGLPNGHVIFDLQGAPRPQRPYATIHAVNPGKKVGLTDDLIMTGQQASVSGMRECTVTINLYGMADQNMGPVELLGNVRDTLDLPSTNDVYFTPFNLAIVECSDVRDLSSLGLEETSYQQRAQMDLRVRYSVKLDDSLSTIEHVNATESGTNVSGALSIN